MNTRNDLRDLILRAAFISMAFNFLAPNRADASCPPLPAPTGTVTTVTISQASQLSSIVGNAASNTTILLEDGTYSNVQLVFNHSGVTLRSKSGNRDAVIIDGGYTIGEILYIRTDHITVADLTVKRSKDHLAHIVSGAHYRHPLQSSSD